MATLLAGPAAAQVFSVAPDPYSVFIPSPPPAALRDETGPVGVLQRDEPDPNLSGFWLGGQHIVASTVASTIFDDNVFATENNAATDMVFHIRPEINLDNGAGWISYNFNAYGDVSQFVRHNSLNNIDGGESFDVTFDPSERLRIETRTNFVYSHSDPANLVLPVANATISHLPETQSFEQEFSVNHSVGSWELALAANYSRNQFDNLTINKTLLLLSQMNSNVFGIDPRVSYDLSPVVRSFVSGEYRHEADAEGILNANTYTVATGLDFELRRLLQGTVDIGYRQHTYDAPGIGGIGGVTYGLKLAWYPTELLTVSVSGTQDFTDTILNTTGGAPAVANIKTVQGQVDYEILRPVTMSAITSYSTNDYVDVGRTDDLIAAGLGLRYVFNTDWVASMQYRFTTRSSSFSAFGYDRNQAGISIRLKF